VKVSEKETETRENPRENGKILHEKREELPGTRE